MISIEPNPGFAFCSAEKNILALWMSSRSRARDSTYLKGAISTPENLKGCEMRYPILPRFPISRARQSRSAIDLQNFRASSSFIGSIQQARMAK